MNDDRKVDAQTESNNLITPDLRNEVESASSVGFSNANALSHPGATTSNDPFNPARLRLTANYQANLGVKKVITNLPCRKPLKQEWVRVRPGDEWHVDTMVFEDQMQNGDIYLVDPCVWAELEGEIATAGLFLAVNRNNDPFLWRVKLTGADGKTNPWNQSAAQAAVLAQTKWIRIQANTSAGFYEVTETPAQLSDPLWPQMDFQGVLRTCFRDRLIDSVDHIAIRRLRGEV